MPTSGRCLTYSWSETETEIEIRVPLPTGTRRNQLSITLHDEASGANLWRAEIETAGGAERHAERARLRVRPSFWPEPLIDGVLRGSVDARESLYQLTASGGGDAWDCLLVGLRKAPATEGTMWGGVLEGDVPATAQRGADDASANDELSNLGDAGSAARLVQRMAASVDDPDRQKRCAQACASLADTGRSAELLAAKALAQLAIGMRAHPSQVDVQAYGCAVLARMEISPDAPLATCDAVMDSFIAGGNRRDLAPSRLAARTAPRRARPLTIANGGERFIQALIASEGVSLLAGLLQQPAPACDASCAALDVIGRSGSKGKHALVNQGAAASLFTIIASSKATFAWRRTCAMVVLPLAEISDVTVLRTALSAGMLPSFVSLLHCEETDALLSLLLAHAIGALSWRSASSQLRRSLVPQLVSASTSRALIAAARRIRGAPASAPPLFAY